MKTPLLVLVATACIGAAYAAFLAEQKTQLTPPLGGDPASNPIELVHVQAFELDEPFEHTWRAGGLSYRAGHLVVLRANPELVRPRQSAEPVLYVGNQTAQRINAGWPNGNLVVLVPSELLADGRLAGDPRNAPTWFGAPDLPERIDTVMIQNELDMALARGVGPPSPSQRVQAVGTDDERIHARNRMELDLFVADLVELYAPEETDLIEVLRMQ